MSDYYYNPPVGSELTPDEDRYFQSLMQQADQAFKRNRLQASDNYLNDAHNFANRVTNEKREKRERAKIIASLRKQYDEAIRDGDADYAEELWEAIQSYGVC